MGMMPTHVFWSPYSGRLVASAAFKSNTPLAMDALCAATFLLHEVLQADCMSPRRGDVAASKILCVLT